MEQDHREQLTALLAPIPAAPPGGIDLAYSQFYEQIREARRADDPSLAQGDWAKTLKVADWSGVIALCETALRKRSKDLQLALWYAEAMTRQKGFAGAACGFRLMTGLLEEHWEHLYPRDPEERMGKLEWLNSQFSPALRQIALTAPEHGGYDWFRWQESRDVENLHRRGEELYEHAVNEGRLAPEAFDKSARASGLDWYQGLIDDLGEARVAYEGLDSAVQKRFGADAPSLAAVSEAIDACRVVAQRMLEYCGGARLASGADDAAASSGSPHEGMSAPKATRRAAGEIIDRAGAINCLREAARFFRENEPHSPVSLLAERAAKWAMMPFEHWLQAVIKDDATLKQLRELLDIRAE